MRYVAAYLLAVLGGNEAPSASDIKTILGSVGIEAEEDRLNMVIAQLKGKDLEELMEEGSKKLASVSFGGAAGGGVAASGGGDQVADGGQAEAKTEEKKEEPEEDSSDDDMGLSLFG
ncbi:60S acidic ribosomal protein P2 [Aplysia californica]|uniref:Large ribosomal subunit protein P2 n=1 Tax=Aplysia californica TaxID=6500 RepID=A0ABM0JWB6_APLCA|nr:60S acidic ribosomal protein P2 [Aplysia californica]